MMNNFRDGKVTPPLIANSRVFKLTGACRNLINYKDCDVRTADGYMPPSDVVQVPGTDDASCRQCTPGIHVYG